MFELSSACGFDLDVHEINETVFRPLIQQPQQMALQEASDARKVRLLALRARKLGQSTGEGTPEPLIGGRNFDPVSKTLKKHTTAAEMEDTVESNVKGLTEKIIAEDEERRQQELDIFNIAPKRPNWDLKRDMEKKLAKLERRTQEAIHTLIRQRLAAQNGQSDDLVGAMKAQEQQNAANSSDEED